MASPAGKKASSACRIITLADPATICDDACEFTSPTVIHLVLVVYHGTRNAGENAARTTHLTTRSHLGTSATNCPGTTLADPLTMIGARPGGEEVALILTEHDGHPYRN